MANAHLRSTGMGEYTPKGNNYAKLPLKGGTADLGESPSSRWRLKSREDDEFDFWLFTATWITQSLPPIGYNSCNYNLNLFVVYSVAVG